MMQDIGSLLKNIKQHKDVTYTVIECVFSVTGVSLDKKNIVFSEHKNVTYVRLQASGAKKTLLSLKRGELETKLRELNFILQ